MQKRRKGDIKAEVVFVIYFSWGASHVAWFVQEIARTVERVYVK